jgi:HEAT repeat protein
MQLGYKDEVVLEKIDKAADILDVREQMTGNATGIVYRGFPLGSYIARLHGASPEERPILIRAIASFGFDAASASPELIAALSDPSAKVRAAAAAALAQVGPHSSPATIPALAKALSDAEPEVRDLAATALGSMGSKAAPAVPELIIALSDPVDYVRAPAADALGAIGPKAAAAVMPPALRLSAKDEGFVLDSVAYALGDIRHWACGEGRSARTAAGVEGTTAWGCRPGGDPENPGNAGCGISPLIMVGMAGIP